MNTNLKRFFSGALASLLLASSLNLGFANYDDVDKSDMLLLNKLSSTGIMIGTDNGFEPNKELTRIESIAIAVRLKGVSEATVKAAEGKTAYTDVQDGYWGSGYINVATSLGLTKGIGNGKFGADNKISYAETLTLAARALGAGPLVDMQGTWPTNYMQFAVEESLSDGVYKSAASIVNRIETAKIMGNTLEAAMWVKSGVTTGGGIEYSKDATKTLLKSVLKVGSIEGKLLSSMKVIDREVTIDGKDYKMSQNLVIDVEVGMVVDAWLNSKDEVIRLAAAEKADQKVSSFDKVKAISTSKLNVYVNGTAKEYDFASSVNVTINGESGKAISDAQTLLNNDAKKNNTFGKIVVENSKITGLFLTQYSDFMVVEKVNDKKILNDNDVVSKSTLDLNNKDYIIVDQNGRNISLSDIKAGDTIMIAKSGSNYRLQVVNNIKSGKVTEKSSSDEYIKLGTTKYNVNALINPSLPSLNDTVSVYLDNNGQIIAFEMVEDEIDGSFGIITEAAAIINGRGTVSAEVQITLLDGTVLPIRELDLEEMVKTTKFGANLFDTTSVTQMNKHFYTGTAGAQLLGEMIRFREVSGKIELIEVMEAYVGKSAAAIRDNGTDSKDELKTITGYNIDVENNKLVKASNPTYRIDNNTVVILEHKSSTENFKTEVEIVPFSSLNNNANKIMTLGKVNEDTNVVKYVYIREDQSISRNANDQFGLIKDVAETSTTGEFRLTLLTNDGEKELLVKNGTTFDSTFVGKFASYTEKDGKVIGITTRDIKGTTSISAKVNKFNANTIKLSQSGTPTVVEVLDSSKNLLFISVSSINTGSTPYALKDMEIGSMGDIVLMSNSENFTTADSDVTTVYLLQLDTDNDGSFDDEIGIVIYVRD